VIAMTLGMATVTLGIVAFSTLEARLDHARDENSLLCRSIQEAARQRAAIRRELDQRVSELDRARGRELERARLVLQAADEAAFRRSLSASRELLDALERDEARARGEVVAALQEQIRDVGDDLAASIRARTTMEEDFRRIEERWAASVFLIRCEFDYRSRVEGGEVELKTGSGWGSGFVLDAEGYLVTNKHVVEPWKFDPEICALVAMGEIEVLPQSARISAWPSGCTCVDPDGRPRSDEGYNNFQLRNLRVVLTAEDRFSEEPLNVGRTRLDYRIHELDDHDLAIVRIEGGTFEPLPTLPPVMRPRLAKLDPIMALGFPRGHGGLEVGIAETSPSLGTIRKIESTIHVTASIIPGNSGGPLFNRDGMVIGIVTRIYSETLGICLKIEHACELLQAARTAESALAATPSLEALEASGN
jgi:S1-C subfamily serine protease